MDEHYKHEHETFVLNDGEGNALVVALCILHAPVFVTICKICKTFTSSESILSVVLEFLIVIYPLLLIVTVFSKFVIESFVVSTILLIMSSLAFIYYAKSTTSQKGAINQSIGTVSSNKLEFLSLFKGINMLLTLISILAVDFKVFPRSFAKTEAYGIGLMDIGVATFIIASALTSRAARGIDSSNISSNEKVTSTKLSHWTKHLLAFSRVQRLVVLLLGLMRLIILKSLNYYEHISEYGVHWNFFVTLFIIWTVADILNVIVSQRLQLALATLLLCIYQYMLSACGLGNYILSEERTNFISANKEGIFSLLGCIPLYIISQQLSNAMFFQIQANENKSNSSLRRGETKFRHRLTTKMVICTFVLWILWGVTNTLVQEMSRRFMNIAFLAFSLAISFSVLSLLAITEDFFEGTITGSIRTLECINLYQLQIFLFANVLTGMINLTIKTIYVSDINSLLILALYCFLAIFPFYVHKSFTT